MAENNEVMEMATLDEVDVSTEEGASKLDTATTIFCVTGSAIAIGGFLKKYGKKAWDHRPNFMRRNKVEKSEDN